MTYNIRQITLDDVLSLVKLRVKLFYEMNLISSLKEEERFSQACFKYFSSSIKKGEFIAWLAESAGVEIASSGLVFSQKPPSPNNLTGKEAYIMNMYTVPEWRKKGIGSTLFQHLLNYVKTNQISIIRLHTTDIGRELYEHFGFKREITEMVYHLDQED